MKSNDAVHIAKDLDRSTLDHRHESDVRGEHRYPDATLSQAEQDARQQRDELKENLTRRPHTDDRRRTDGTEPRPNDEVPANRRDDRDPLRRDRDEEHERRERRGS